MSGWEWMTMKEKVQFHSNSGAAGPFQLGKYKLLIHFLFCQSYSVFGGLLAKEKIYNKNSASLCFAKNAQVERGRMLPRDFLRRNIFIQNKKYLSKQVRNTNRSVQREPRRMYCRADATSWFSVQAKCTPFKKAHLKLGGSGIKKVKTCFSRSGQLLERGPIDVTGSHSGKGKAPYLSYIHTALSVSWLELSFGSFQGKIPFS